MPFVISLIYIGEAKKKREKCWCWYRSEVNTWVEVEAMQDLQQSGHKLSAFSHKMLNNQQPTVFHNEKDRYFGRFKVQSRWTSLWISDDSPSKLDIFWLSSSLVNFIYDGSSIFSPNIITCKLSYLAQSLQ